MSRVDSDGLKKLRFLTDFFRASAKKAEAIQEKLKLPAGGGDDKAPAPVSARPTLADRISLSSLYKIFTWIGQNKGYVYEQLVALPHQHAMLSSHQLNKSGYSFEIIQHPLTQKIFLFIKTKSKLGYEDAEGKPAKLPEDKGHLNGKIFARGAYKKVEYCFYWIPGFDDPKIYTESVVKGKESDALHQLLTMLENEEKCSHAIGPLYANPGLLGSLRTYPDGVISRSYYAPLGVGDEIQWNECKSSTGLLPPLHETHPDAILYVLYKQLRGLAYIHQLGFIFRDLKPDNILLFAGPGQFVHLDPKFIDFSMMIRKNEAALFPNNFGSYPYIAPESNVFLYLRMQKNKYLAAHERSLQLAIQRGFILSEMDELKCAGQTAEFKTRLQINQSEHDHVCRKIAKIQRKLTLTLEQLPPTIGEEAPSIILNTTQKSQLVPADFESGRKESVYFAPDPKDDVFALSKSTLQILAVVPFPEAYGPVIKALELLLKQNYVMRAQRRDSQLLLEEFEKLLPLLPESSQLPQAVEKLKAQELDKQHCISISGKKSSSAGKRPLEREPAPSTPATAPGSWQPRFRFAGPGGGRERTSTPLAALSKSR